MTSSSPQSSSGASLQKVKCLLVDDLPENILALSALLKRDDVELLTARTGSEALELLLAHDVALAFLDVQMPDMDGFELAELMRGSDRSRHVPIIFVTAGSRDQHRLFKGYETGAVDFLYKPIEPHILRNKADVFFQLYRQKQQLTQELHERTETLRLNEMFTAVLGHDLRNPLSAILTSAEILHRRSTDESVRKAAQRMLSSGMRMTRMIEAMLDLARARLAGGIPLVRESSDLEQAVRRVVQEHQEAAAGRKLEVHVQGDTHGSWDTDRLAQVTSNLVGNAIEHGQPEEPVLVRLDGSSGSKVELTVTNRGTIPEDLLPHLFDPFRGGREEGKRAGGLGLGLYIVQQIAEAHQGEVVVDSSGNHTTFKVTVPRSANEIIRL